MDIYKDYLMHHGIEGQKWGVRHGPPYPLDYKTKRDAHIGRKAGMSKFKSDVDNSFEEMHNLGNNKLFNSALYVSKNQSSFLKAKPGVPDNSVFDTINSTYEKEAGTTQNCQLASACSELMCRGYRDIRAGRTVLPILTGAMSYWYDCKTPEKNSDTVSGATQELMNMPIGSRGSIGGGRYSGDGKRLNGHSIFWVRDENGITFHDNQSQRHQSFNANNRAMSNPLQSIWGFTDGKGSFTIQRLDDATPNWNHLAEDSVIRTNSSMVYSRDMNSIKNTILGGGYNNNGGQTVRFEKAPGYYNSDVWYTHWPRGGYT